MKIVGRSHFVGKAQRRFANFPFPWDEERGIRVRSLTPRELAEYEARMLKKRRGQLSVDDNALIEAKRAYLVITLVDETDQPFLNEADIAEMERDGRDVEFAYKCAQEHVGFDDADIRELVGNSKATTNSDSPPVSASTGALTT